MKILHCITSLDVGGAEKTLVRLVNNSKYKHTIITIKYSHKLKVYLNKEVNIISLFPLSKKGLLRVIDTIRKFKPDIIQGWMYHGDLLASIIGLIFLKPIFWNIRHGKMSFRYSSKFTLIIRFILSIFSHIVPKKIISCYNYGAKIHKRIGYCSSKFYVIHNGISLINNLSKDYYELLNKKNLKIASIGRDSPQKNRKYFLQIVDILSKYLPIEPIIIGRGIPESKYLLEFRKNKDYPIKLQSSVENIEEVFKSIDILLLTSSFGEGCPNIVIEAMKYGLLVFSTDVGDAKYLVNNERLIIPINNPFFAVKKILALLRSSDINNIIKNNRKRADLIFNEHDMILKYEEIWSSNYNKASL